MDHPLGKEKLSKLIIQYSIPSIISFVVNSLYNMVDQVFIGQGVGYLTSQRDVPFVMVRSV